MGFEAGIVIRHGDSYKDNEYFWNICGWNKTDLVDTLICLLSDNEYYSVNDLAMKEETGAFDFEVEKLSSFFELRERLENNTKGVYRNLRKLYLLDLDDVAGEYFHDLPITEKVAFYHQFYFEDMTKLNIAKSFLHDMSHDEFIFIIDSLADTYLKLSEKEIDTAEFYISY
jgi:hypothetical protein